MVNDTTLLKFILTLEYKRRKVVLAFESMDQTKFFVVLFRNSLRVVLSLSLWIGRNQTT